MGSRKTKSNPDTLSSKSRANIPPIILVDEANDAKTIPTTGKTGISSTQRKVRWSSMVDTDELEKMNKAEEEW